LRDFIKEDDELVDSVCLNAYVFDFLEQPSAFSEAMVNDQAAFASHYISKMMVPGGLRGNFNLITHSTGAVVAYKMM